MTSRMIPLAAVLSAAPILHFRVSNLENKQKLIVLDYFEVYLENKQTMIVLDYFEVYRVTVL